MKIPRRTLALGSSLAGRFATACVLCAAGTAQAAPYTYRGSLHSDGEAAEGLHAMRLTLYSAPSGGFPVAAPVLLANVPVHEGLFEAEAEFAPSIEAYDTLWLEVAVDGGQGLSVLPRRERLQPKASSACWATNGNAGTNPALDFLGTLDPQPLSFRVGDMQALLLQPGVPAGISPNLQGGGSSNLIENDVRGSFIGGGGVVSGADPDFPDEVGNNIQSHYSVVGGGASNLAGGAMGNPLAGAFATVGGGSTNRATHAYAYVGGGLFNAADEIHATVAGGRDNLVGGSFGVIAGGSGNRAATPHASVLGGQQNQAQGRYSAVGGGLRNVAAGVQNVIAGGLDNETAGEASTVSGGKNNLALGHYATVPGGQSNIASGNHSFSAGMGSASNHDGSFVWSDASNAIGFATSGANQFLVRATGGVGLGTATPQNQLHVAEATSGLASPANHVAQIENSSTNGSPDVLALRVRTSGNPDAGFNFITFFDGDYVSGAGGTDESLGSLQGNGAGGVVLAGPGNDYAEWLRKADPDQSIGPGDVVGVRNGSVSLQTEQADFIMVASTGAIVAGNDPGEQARDGWALVAFLGQAQVRVRGAVAPGDYLLPSGVGDGVAVAVAPGALDPGLAHTVLGRAWSGFSGTGEGRVPTVIGLSRVDAAMTSENRALRRELSSVHAELQRQRQLIDDMELQLARAERRDASIQAALAELKSDATDIFVATSPKDR